ncbi:MAG: ABC transporter ATP-binding protein, partial [Porphyromonadaceae bacterium]|nr:ABC transporter ATP-binding protein [Porphyromonadaceae bacterium]
EFDGTLIVVSHDREFLDGLVSKVYEFGQQKVREHLGGIYDFLERKKMASLRELEMGRKVTPTAVANEKRPASVPTSVPVSENKMSFEARKEWQKKIKRQERAVADTEQRIAKLDAEIAVIESRLSTPEGMADIDLCMKHGALKRESATLTDLWVSQTGELETLQKAFDGN